MSHADPEGVNEWDAFEPEAGYNNVDSFLFTSESVGEGHPGLYFFSLDSIGIILLSLHQTQYHFIIVDNIVINHFLDLIRFI